MTESLSIPTATGVMAPADESLGDQPRSTAALQKRADQLKRWAESDTNKEQSSPKDKKQKVLFDKRVCFLAACAAGDYEEINSLLSRGAADIDACQEDGMTSLHQACIDDQLDMVKFLVSRGADINRGDNEGWTPLHATASCGYLAIAKFLIENGARVDIVNNDGELPIDIADTDEMENLLQTEIYKQGVDIELARNEEEQIMLRDIKAYYEGASVKENIHPRTGATPLHVAAAKGYQDIMRMLLELGVDVNAKDADGWTPLHAAAHWGHREGCKMLVEHGCDMEGKTNMLQTVIDLCEPDLVSFLEDLQKRQPTLVKEKSAQMEQQGRRQPLPLKRRISANKGVASEKVNIHAKEAAFERAQMEAQRPSGLDVNMSSVPTSATPKLVEATGVPTGGASSTYQSPYASVRPQPPVRVPDDAFKPISFLQPSEPKQVPQTAPVPVAAAPARPAAEKPISFLPPVDSKPISFLVPRESPFPLTSKLPPSPSSVEAPAKDKAPVEKFTPLSYLRNDAKDVQPSWSPKPQTTDSSAAAVPKIVTVNHPVTQKVSSTPAVSAKPVLPTLPSFEYIDDNSSGPSPPAESPRTEAGRERSRGNSIAGGAGNHFFGSSESGASADPGTATVRRSFQPPSRDDESEAQRKAHAKRIRETRRSTQGVSADDLKAADAQTKGSASNPAAAPPPPTTISYPAPGTISYPAPSSQPARTSRDEEKENFAAKPNSSSTRLSIPTVNSLSSGADTDASKLRPLSIPASPDAVITLPLRKNKAEEDADDPKNTRRRRPKRRSTGVVNIDMEDEEGSASGTDLIDVPAKPEEVIPTTQNGLLQAHLNNNGTQSTPKATDHSSYSRTRYNDTSNDRTPTTTTTTSTPSYRTTRTPSISSTSSVISEKGETDNSEHDWKKLYEQEKAENEKLKKKLQAAEKDLDDTRHSTSSGRTPADRASETEKRERRALERKLAEMEEELKELETLRADNQRLKEENGALIRVISKLSK